MELKGIGVSEGMALGPAVFLQAKNHLDEVPFTNFDNEADLFKTALMKVRQDTETLVERLRSQHQPDEAAIFEAHLLMIDDPEVHELTIQLIRQEKWPAAKAYRKAVETYIAQIEAIEDEYLRQRAVDLKDIRQRVLDALAGESQPANQWPQGSILICDDLTPSQTASLDLSRVKGFISRKGSKTSHSAILARALEIPAVLGAERIFDFVQPQQLVALDGASGEIQINPALEQQAALEAKMRALKAKRDELRSLKELSSQTLDGQEVVLAANIGLEQDLKSVVDNGAEAVGLYRTEFLFMDKTAAPSEEEQFQIYSRIFAHMPGKKIFIRTLDIGGDKRLPYLEQKPEENPFLGNRAVRLCLRDPAFFKIQLRAILRAATDSDVGVMIPMISSIAEILQTKRLLADCREELKKEGKRYAEHLDFGVMIEVPAAALIMDHVCRHVDFVSIGTNDLTQYVCAVDRMNSDIQELYDSAHPGLIRLVEKIISTAKATGTFVGICGSVAHDHDLLPLWLGMGVDELSMSAQHILPAKRRVRSLKAEECRAAVLKAMDCETGAEIRELLKRLF